MDMAKTNAKPITVKITSATAAMDEINKAIAKALGREESIVNKQYSKELKLQSKMASEEDKLNLAGAALNGPPVGITIPTTDQLLAPLRDVLQKTEFYPCDANPFDGATDPSAVDKSTKPSSTSGTTPVGVLNFTIQKLMYGLLVTPFTQLLAGYSNSSDISLEEQVVSYIQQQVTTIIEQQITQANLLNNAKSQNLGADIQNALDENKTPGVKAKISQIENQYVDILNGFNSPVFPPPGGKDFLTNLENLIMLSINNQVQGSLKAATTPANTTPSTGNTAANNASGSAGSSTVQTPVLNAQTIAQLKALIAKSSLIRKGVDNALFNQISLLGIQGTLLADALDTETSTGIKQNLTSMLNFLDDYKKDLNDANTTALAEAQAVLASKSAVETFIETWDVTQDALNANEETLQSGTVTYTSLNNQLNGNSNNNRAYLAALIYNNVTGGGPQVLDNAESLSTQITGEMAGLQFLSNATLNKQTGLNQVNSLDTMINQQFQADITNLQTALEKYSSALSAYLKTSQDYNERESMANAAAGVEEQVRIATQAGPSLNPTFN